MQPHNTVRRPKDDHGHHGSGQGQHGGGHGHQDVGYGPTDGRYSWEENARTSERQNQAHIYQISYQSEYLIIQLRQ